MHTLHKTFSLIFRSSWRK